MLLAAAVCFAATSAVAQSDAPPEGAWLRYHYEEVLTEGTGEYAGYTERTVARARYEVVEVGARAARLRSSYTWRYRSPERDERQTIEREASFGLEDRRYTTGRTDVSDYDHRDGRQLATWIWIPPSVQVGDTLQILERSDFRVVSLSETINVAGAPRAAIVVEARYTGRRDDDYGLFTTEVVDRYWFDSATGMFLREVHDERDRGSYEGRSASFRMLTTIDVIDASYAPATTPPGDDREALGRAAYVPPSPERSSRPDRGGSGACVFGSLVVVLAFVLIAATMRRPRVRRRVTGAGVPFRVERVSGASAALPPGLSAHFDALLPHFIAVTRATNNAVSVATTEPDGKVVGVALSDLQSGVGSIFARDSDVCEALRRESGHTEFFSELRHPPLESVLRSGLTAPAHAYNVYETYEVLELRARPEDLGYDTEVVSPMREDEREQVIALLNAVYGVACGPWLAASLAHGDLAWVAHDQGRVVGVAMATLVGTTARLHTLTVHPQHRQRGLGTALYRARLRALFDLDAARVITECATWNLAACELARAHGFQKVGEMFVETSRSQRDERRFVRR